MQRFGPKPRRRRKTDDPRWNKFFDEDQKEEARRQEILEMSLADAGLSVRTTNTLEGKNIFNVAALASQSREDLLAIDNFGEQTLSEVSEAVDKLGVFHSDWNLPRSKRPVKKPVSKKGSRKSPKKKKR